MTETVETVEEAPVFSVEDWFASLGDQAGLARPVVARIESQINARNSVATRYLSLTGDSSQLLSERRESSVNPAVVERRDKAERILTVYNTLMAEMDELLKADLHSDETATPEDLKTQLSDLDKEIKAALQFAEPIFGESLHQAIPSLVPVKGTRQGGKSGAGSGIARPRVSAIYVDGNVCSRTVKDKDGNDKTVSTFTVLSQELGVAVPDLHAAWHLAAGTTDVPAGAVVEFVISDSKGANRMVAIHNSN